MKYSICLYPMKYSGPRITLLCTHCVHSCMRRHPATTAPLAPTHKGWDVPIPSPLWLLTPARGRLLIPHVLTATFYPLYICFSFPTFYPGKCPVFLYVPINQNKPDLTNKLLCNILKSKKMKLSVLKWKQALKLLPSTSEFLKRCPFQNFHTNLHLLLHYFSNIFTFTYQVWG